MDLSRREMLPELMDDPGLDARRHEQALRGLRRINRWSGSARILWPTIREIAGHLDRPLRLLDVATGGGDVPIALARRARREGITLELFGCDISPQALAFAAEQIHQSNAKVHLFRLDALHDAIPPDYDVITSSLFLHHLARSDGLALLQRISAAAQHAILVNDLVRNRRGYCLAWAACRILSRSPIVHTDGPLSVRAAYTVDEVEALAKEAGLKSVQIQRKWPARFLMSWTRG